MYAVVLCTTPRAEAPKVAGSLVEEKLVACVNIASVDSVFWWEGKIEQENEALLIMKTTTEKVDAVIGRVRQLHSYEVPEVIALPIIAGNDDYLDWVRGSVG